MLLGFAVCSLCFFMVRFGLAYKLEFTEIGYFKEFCSKVIVFNIDAGILCWSFLLVANLLRLDWETAENLSLLLRINYLVESYSELRYRTFPD